MVTWPSQHKTNNVCQFNKDLKQFKAFQNGHLQTEIELQSNIMICMRVKEEGSSGRLDLQTTAI